MEGDEGNVVTMLPDCIYTVHFISLLGSVTGTLQLILFCLILRHV